MPPKKKAAKAATSDEPGQQPEALLKVYNDFCKRLGLAPHAQVAKSLTNAENPFVGRQIIIDGGAPKDPKLGAGGMRALSTSVMGIGEGMPRQPIPDSKETKPIMYKQLQELRVWRSNIGDDGASSLAELLRLGGAEIQLQYLELMDNDITAIGAFALGRSLSCMMNRSLLTLSLDYNMSLKSEGVAALCMGLRTNSTLKKLSLQYCDIDEDSGGPLGEMLAFTKLGLSILDLKGNRLGGIGLRDMCPGLLRNKSLTSIVIADNNICTRDTDVEGLRSFAEVLFNHPTLSKVDMQYNRIESSGATILIPALDPKEGNKNITAFLPDASIENAVFEKIFKNGGGGKKKGKKKKSDLRLKTDIVPIDVDVDVDVVGCSGEENVKESVKESAKEKEEEDDDAKGRPPQLQLYRYKYTRDPLGKVQVGVMAQDLIGGPLNDAVSEEFDIDDGWHLQVNYEKLNGIVGFPIC